MSELFSINQLSKSFGGLNAVNNLSFSVGKQEILGLIGPNGAGKSTVFNLIMGVHRPDKGSVLYKEKNITGWKTFKVVNEGIARVFQIAQPMPLKTVYQNVEVSTFSNNIFASGKNAQDAELCAHCCDLTGLTPELDKYPSTLTQAGLRRLEVAKAMATGAELLLLDEPFAGLTAQEMDKLSDLVTALRDEGRTIIIVDHNMKGLMRMVDRVVVVNFGEKLAEGTPDEILNNQAVQDAYLAGGTH
jgi:branched-chain amino acid transport system ATP-binding protein